MLMLQEIGGLDASAPSEGAGGASEQLSEAAKEKFAQASKQIKQIIREEKKARKRDDSVAKTIMQFLGDEAYAAFFPLISHLASRDCPSIFILAVLSLIHEPSKQAVEEYTKDNRINIAVVSAIERAEAGNHASEATPTMKSLPAEFADPILLWISRLELVMKMEAQKILMRLMIDEENIDGTVLELTTSVLVEFFARAHRPVSYDDLQPLTMSILQTVIEPYVDIIEEHFRQLQEEQRKKQEEE